ncbi:proteinase-activated receptor 1-like [Petromyzon marinus]|uniref:proteinase-activated receptor 1-like n=1 Tax=Petromyzon marinus TaxID=7757 RepID=UPI003F721343
MDLSQLLPSVIIPTFYSVAVILGLPLNLLAVCILASKKKDSMSVYMVNLAAADTSFLLVLPMKIVYHLKGNHWSLPGFFCRVYTMTFFSTLYTATMLVAAISMDRYLAIVHPLWVTGWRKTRTAWIVSAVIWTLAVSHSVPSNFVTILSVANATNNSSDPPRIICYEAFTKEDLDFLVPFRLFLFVTLYFTSLVVTLFSYGNIIRVLVTSQQSNQEKKSRATKITVVSILIYVFCFSPYNATHLVAFASSKMSNFSYHAISILRDITLCLCSLNSLFDPLIIYIASSAFRSSVKNIFSCRLTANQVSSSSV